VIYLFTYFLPPCVRVRLAWANKDCLSPFSSSSYYYLILNKINTWIINK
jgi:hypothetical protein